MGVTAGEVLGVRAPGASETVRLPIMLLDSAGAPVTGVAYDAAGVTIQLAKEGDSAFAAWATVVGNAFAAANWDEIGYGNYDIILRGSVAGEVAVLNTEGHLRVYVGFTATRGDTFLFKVNPADASRADGAIDIYVHGTSGNDTTGNGSQALPYATITKALTVAVDGRGDRIHLMPGAYTLSEAAYPVSVSKSYVKIIGPGPQVVLDAGASAGQHAMMLDAVGVEISGFKVVGPDGRYSCVISSYDDQSFMDMSFDCQSGDDVVASGLYVAGNRASIVGCSFYGDGSGLVLNNGDDHKVNDCYFYNNHVDDLVWSIDIMPDAERALILRNHFVPTDGVQTVVAVDGKYCVIAFNDGNFVLDGTYVDIDVSNITMQNEQWAVPGDEMDLVDSPNETAIDAIQAGFASTGSGAKSVAITVLDQNDDPVRCDVSIPSTANGVTNASTGVITFGLDAGVYSVTLGPKGGYTFSNPYTLTVTTSASQTATLECVKVNIEDPSGANECTVYGYIYDQNNDPVANAVVKIRMYNPPGVTTDDGVGIKSNEVSYLTNASGYFSATLVRSSEFPEDVYYEIRCDAIGYRKVIIVPDASTVNWSDLEEASV